MIQDYEGHICSTPQQALETWIRFFQEMEGGQRIDATHQRSLWIDNLKSFQATSLHLDIDDIPSLVELEMAYRHVHPHKATGPDRIDASLCAKHPAMFARKTYSQLLKLYAHGQESLLHKGGRLQPIWKQKGPRHLCSAYRSVLISSHVGKSLHRCIRLHTADTFEHYLQSQQIGGKRGVPVSLGVHQARAFMRSRSRRGLCTGLLFLDLSEAFYRVVRQLALGGPPDDHAIAAIGARLQLGPGRSQDLHSHLDEPSAIERAGLSPQLQVLRALQTLTFMWVFNQTPAGRPWAPGLATVSQTLSSRFFGLDCSKDWNRLCNKLASWMSSQKNGGCRLTTLKASRDRRRSFVSPTLAQPGWMTHVLHSLPPRLPIWNLQRAVLAASFSACVMNLQCRQTLRKARQSSCLSSKDKGPARPRRSTLVRILLGPFLSSRRLAHGF